MGIVPAMQAYGAYRETKAQQQAATYNAKVQEQNARLAELQAQDTESRGRLEEDAYRKRLGQAKGSQLAALAGTGVDLGSGSALGLRQDLSAAGDLDALSIRMNTQREAYAQRLSGTSALAQSRLSKMQAKYANPYLATGTTYVGQSAQYAASWYGGGK